MIITISGMPGAGKSTVGKIVAKELGLKYYSVGDLRGKMAQERKMTIEELNKLGERHDFTDKEADAYQANLAQSEDNFIMDSRLGFHFIPESIKVFLDVDIDEAARRILGDKRHDEREYKGHEDAKRALQERLSSDTKRYKQYYGIDYLNKSNYDLVVDTTNDLPEAFARKIVEFVKKSKSRPKKEK